jgi:hypothetical protein
MCTATFLLDNPFRRVYKGANFRRRQAALSKTETDTENKPGETTMTQQKSTTQKKTKENKMMDQKQMMKQMLEMNKIACDNTFQTITTIQEQTEAMTQKMVEQATWMPEEGRKAIDEWLKAYKSGRDNFKKMVDDAFAKVLKSF